MKTVRACSLLGLPMTALAAWSVPATLSLLAVAAPASAQSGAMVQATPPAMAVERLNQNLTRLSRAPTDMEALIGAGMASYELGDAQAANGFFTRANLVNPRVGRVKLGLALVSVALKQPRDAATYFDDAAELGEPANAWLAERALTYDLTGQQDKAQRDYVAALQASPGNSDLIRAYAVSLGISGKVDLAEAQLRPLLYKSDRAAWRDRTMILAMNGRTAEARKIAQTIMPRSLADGMEPYLVRMGSLSPAQKAAATHYGQFPAEGLRLATVTSPPAVQAPARTDTASRRSASRDRRKPVAAPAAAPTEDSSLLAAMPRGDMPPAMVQPVPSSAPVPMASSRSVPNAASDDDPDGYTADEQRRAARTATASAVPARVTTRSRATASYPATAYGAPVPSVAPRVPEMVQPVAGPVTSAPAMVRPAAPYAVAQAPAAVATVQPVPRPVVQPVPTPASTAAAVAPVQAMAPSSARPVQGPFIGPDPVPANPAAVAVPTAPTVPSSAPVQAAPVPAAPIESVASTAPIAEVPQPGFIVPPVAGAAPATPLRTLAAIMADIQVSEDAARAAAAPAVDLDEVARMQAVKRKAVADKAKKEAAAKLKAEADAKLKAEAEEKARLKANPARIWVQIATGRDPAALAFDMRRLRKTYAVLADEDAFTVEWGATRRLLVGPYISATKAKAVLGDLKKAGSDGFVWQSEAGETVTRLSGK